MGKKDKVLIDTLINNGVVNHEENISLGSLSNLEAINGFRKLKLNRSFESIEFDNPLTGIDLKYKSKGIIIVNIKNTKIDLFGPEDELELTFLDSMLSKIKISNERINKSSYQALDYYTQAEDLIKLFGNPSKVNKNKIYQEDMEWKSNKIFLTFLHGWEHEFLEGYPKEYLIRQNAYY